MSDAPRTDAAWSSGFDPVILSAAELARRLREQCADLERENAALREENAKWRKMIREAVCDNNDILYWIRGARSILLDAVEKDRAAYAARKEAKP